MVNNYLTHCHRVCQHNLWLSSVIVDDTVHKAKQVPLKIFSFYLIRYATLTHTQFNKIDIFLFFSLFFGCTSLWEKWNQLMLTLLRFFLLLLLFLRLRIFVHRRKLLVHINIQRKEAAVCMHIQKIEKWKSENHSKEKNFC